jgi:hypothetical protein
MTFDQILEDVKRVRPCSRRTLYLFIKLARVRPMGPRQRPQNYPKDSARRILSKLGYDEGVDQ